jgi:hypothetical protein
MAVFSRRQQRRRGSPCLAGVSLPPAASAPKVSIDMLSRTAGRPHSCLSSSNREAARAELYGHAAHFASDVFVCLDRPPCREGIEAVDPGRGGRAWRRVRQRVLQPHMFGIGNAVGELTRVRSDDDRGANRPSSSRRCSSHGPEA